MGREKEMRNTADLMSCLTKERKKRNIDERSVFNF